MHLAAGLTLRVIMVAAHVKIIRATLFAMKQLLVESILARVIAIGMEGASIKMGHVGRVEDLRHVHPLVVGKHARHVITHVEHRDVVVKHITLVEYQLVE